MNEQATDMRHKRRASNRAHFRPAGCPRRRCRGAGLVELLMASLILSIGLMALMSVWNFAFAVTVNTDDQGVAYNIGRQAIERVKKRGFSYAEGTTTLYYDGNQQVQASNASPSRYSVTTSVVSAAVISGVAGQAGAVPDQNNLRTVTVTVQLISTAQTLYTTTTYLARAGI